MPIYQLPLALASGFDALLQMALAKSQYDSAKAGTICYFYIH
jgi:hypothetical protein